MSDQPTGVPTPEPQAEDVRRILESARLFEWLERHWGVDRFLYYGRLGGAVYEVYDAPLSAEHTEQLGQGRILREALQACPDFASTTSPATLDRELMAEVTAEVLGAAQLNRQAQRHAAQLDAARLARELDEARRELAAKEDAREEWAETAMKYRRFLVRLKREVGLALCEGAAYAADNGTLAQLIGTGQSPQPCPDLVSTKRGETNRKSFAYPQYQHIDAPEELKKLRAKARRYEAMMAHGRFKFAKIMRVESKEEQWVWACRGEDGVETQFLAGPEEAE